MAALSSTWSDLPIDLLVDISSRLHTGTDYVRFHAVCKPWRDSIPPPERRPALLPWLLARCDITGRHKALCVFSSTEMYHCDRRYAICAEDGTAACYLSALGPKFNVLAGCPLAGPSAISIALPPYSAQIEQWVSRAAGVVTGDGTVFLHAFGYHQYGIVSRVMPIWAAILRPGDTSWTFVQKDDLSFYLRDRDSCCVAYHRGKIVLCCNSSWKTMSVQAGGLGTGVRPSGKIEHEGGKVVRSRYLVESNGELLWAFVHVTNAYDYMAYCADDFGHPTNTLFVTVHQLQDDGGGPRWVQRDGQSLTDCILFLGQQGSFTVDAARFGIPGGYAYFVARRSCCFGLTQSGAPPKLSRVYKYSFQDGMSELVEQLPAHWNHEPCMWHTPQPAIAGS